MANVTRCRPTVTVFPIVPMAAMSETVPFAMVMRSSKWPAFYCRHCRLPLTARSHLQNNALRYRHDRIGRIPVASLHPKQTGVHNCWPFCSFLFPNLFSISLVFVLRFASITIHHVYIYVCLYICVCIPYHLYNQSFTHARTLIVARTSNAFCRCTSVTGSHTVATVVTSLSVVSVN